MSPARITYHALNVLVSTVLIAALVATSHGHHPDWLGLVLVIALMLSGLSSMSALRQDKPEWKPPARAGRIKP